MPFTESEAIDFIEAIIDITLSLSLLLNTFLFDY